MPVELGWLDTNVFVHAMSANDPHQPRCRAILEALENDTAHGWIEPIIIHELSHVLSRRQAFGTRAAIAIYLTALLSYPGVLAPDKPLLASTVARWAAGTVGFVDAYLAELAQRDGLPVCTVNARDFPTTPNSFATAAL